MKSCSKNLKQLDTERELDSGFLSFLPEEIFLVNIENNLRFWKKFLWSILGSLVFLIYLNDIPQEVVSTLLLYADDSCNLYQHKEVDEIEKLIPTQRSR